MEIVKENTKLLERKHFLMRAANNKNSPEIELEIDKLDYLIKLNTSNRLNELNIKLKQDITNVRTITKNEGSLKREIASILINFLEEQKFNPSEVKGIMRQGYQICRHK